ncbi:MAG: aminoglycoside phosphotransferase family protein [Planctomycetota bacterium]
MDQPDALEHVQGLEPTDQAVPADLTPAASEHLESLPDEPLAAQPFGAALTPVLLDICEGKLAKVRWFRTDWQRGGALTGYSTWTDDTGAECDVVVKMPVPPAERRWLVRLSSDEITPRIYAHGTALGGYDLAWVVMERLPHGPVGRKWGDNAIELICEAAAHFYASTRIVAPEGRRKPRDWAELLDRARKHATPRMLPDAQRWKKALKQASKKLPEWLSRWGDRPRDTWCHGDLHLGNAMTRVAPPDGPAVLFDLANIHVGHWVEDAVYFEHLYWARPKRLGSIKPVQRIAHYLKDYGIDPGSDWAELANLKRALLAMASPALMDVEGGAVQVAAAIEVLERYL